MAGLAFALLSAFRWFLAFVVLLTAVLFTIPGVLLLRLAEALRPSNPTSPEGDDDATEEPELENMSAVMVMTPDGFRQLARRGVVRFR
ncbi:MAG: hypothetical protein HY716_10725 [Planctomycetes bacterium]|nr:hypothetical protein [Planctomycetota bacterium]